MKTSFKKIISAVILSAMLFSLICLPTIAAEDQFSGKLSLAEDYSSATYNGKMYVSVEFDVSDIYLSNIPKDNITLTEAQASKIKEISASTADAFLFVNIIYNEGGYVSLYYIDSAYYDRYEQFLKNGGAVYTVAGLVSSVDTTLSKLQGEKITLKSYELGYYDVISADVWTTSADGYFYMFSGYVYTDGTDLYYLDCLQFGIEFSNTMNESWKLPMSSIIQNFDEVTVWKITDQALVADISSVYDFDFKDTDFVDEEIGTVSNVIAVIFIIIIVFIFFVIPLAGLIFAIIASIKTKGIYKKLYRALIAVFASEMFIFAVMATLFIISALLQ